MAREGGVKTNYTHFHPNRLFIKTAFRALPLTITTLHIEQSTHTYICTYTRMCAHVTETVNFPQVYALVYT